jgi:ABC-type transport system involved in cytochrome bd biosynthesis fused ATPase/permease subunit
VLETNGRKIEFHSPGFVQLVGAPGSGKTTLLRHMLGYLKEEPFQVSINGQKSHLFVKDMVYLGSAPMIYPESMLSNILLFSTTKTTLDFSDKEFIGSIFPDIDVDTLLEMHPAQLSSGQLQRLSFIQLAFSNRKILMLDETFSSLGAEEKYLLKELQRKMPEALIIFVSHNVEPGTLGEEFVELHRSTK